MTDLKQQFITAMGACATGVSVVTTDGNYGKFGVTVSAWCSVSADPTLVLCCVNSRSPAIEAITENGGFCLNILSTGQSFVANTFAGFVDNGKPFDFGCAEWQKLQHPVLKNSTASFICDTQDAYAQGTHMVFVGQVKQVTTTALKPLIYYARKYCETTAIK